MCRVMCVVILLFATVVDSGRLVGVARGAQLLLVAGSGSQTTVISNARLTPEGLPYRIIASGSRISVYNAGSGSNNREIIWNASMRESSNAAQCATWLFGSGIAQNGFVFRIAEQPGGYNAIVFAQNIFMYWYWRFAPKMFHTGTGYESDWSDVPGIDLDRYLGKHETNTWPLRVCASLDSSNVLRFAVAKGSDPMPSLLNPGIQGGSWKLDMSNYYHHGGGLTGVNGGTFVGHIPLGAAVAIGNNHTVVLG